MKDIDKDLEQLFTDVDEQYTYDYKLEDSIVEVINRPRDYQERLRKSRSRRTWGAIGMGLVLPIYFWTLMNYGPVEDEFMVTGLACMIILMIIGVLFTLIFNKPMVKGMQE